MAWIESHDTLARHPKTRRLVRLLNISTPQAIGHLHLLWWWVATFRPSGRLSGRHSVDPERIAEAVGWEGRGIDFLYGLELAGFLDRTPGGMVVHDWMEWSGRSVKRQHEALRLLQEEYRNLRLAVIARDGDTCQLCSRPVAPGDIHVDHIIPRSKGGPDTLENLRVTHSMCNLRRGNREDWVAG